jgi:hypothetical protein
MMGLGKSAWSAMQGCRAWQAAGLPPLRQGRASIAAERRLPLSPVNASRRLLGSAGVDRRRTGRERLQKVKPSRIVSVVIAGVLATAGSAAAQEQAAAGAVYVPHAPGRFAVFGSGWFGGWGPCDFGACADSPYLRRAIQRELAQLEHLRDLDERAQRALQSHSLPPYGARGERPPPTPEEQVQPAFRGSGEIRPEFSRAADR